MPGYAPKVVQKKPPSAAVSRFRRANADARLSNEAFERGERQRAMELAYLGSQPQPATAAPRARVPHPPVPHPPAPHPPVPRPQARVAFGDIRGGAESDSDSESESDSDSDSDGELEVHAAAEAHAVQPRPVPPLSPPLSPLLPPVSGARPATPDFDLSALQRPAQQLGEPLVLPALPAVRGLMPQPPEASASVPHAAGPEPFYFGPGRRPVPHDLRHVPSAPRQARPRTLRPLETPAQAPLAPVSDGAARLGAASAMLPSFLRPALHAASDALLSPEDAHEAQVTRLAHEYDREETYGSVPRAQEARKKAERSGTVAGVASKVSSALSLTPAAPLAPIASVVAMGAHAHSAAARNDQLTALERPMPYESGPSHLEHERALARAQRTNAGLSAAASTPVIGIAATLPALASNQPVFAAQQELYRHTTEANRRRAMQHLANVKAEKEQTFAHIPTFHEPEP
jgi:hypothetical protein